MAISDTHKGKNIFHFTDLRNLDSIVKNAFVDTKDEESQKIRWLMRKYNKVNSHNQFEALSSVMVPKIVEHIEKGLSLAPMFEKILSQKTRKLTALERLDSYWDKTNEEFDELFDSLVKELKDSIISEPVDIGKSIGYLVFFRCYAIS